MPRGGARPGAGRKPKEQSKPVIERNIIAERKAEQGTKSDGSVKPVPVTVKRGQEALKAAAEAKGQGRKLGREVLEEIMMIARAMAGRYQPGTQDRPNIHQNDDKFQTWLEFTEKTAKDLAEFQSPKFKAVAIVEAPAPPPRQPGDKQVMSPAEAYRMMAAGRLIEGTVTGRSEKKVDSGKAPRAKKAATGG